MRLIFPAAVRSAAERADGEEPRNLNQIRVKKKKLGFYFEKEKKNQTVEELKSSAAV